MKFSSSCTTRYVEPWLIVSFIEVILHELFRFLSVFPPLVKSANCISNFIYIVFVNGWLASLITLYTSPILHLPFLLSILFANSVHFSGSPTNKCDFVASAELFSCWISTVFTTNFKSYRTMNIWIWITVIMNYIPFQ